MAARKKIVMRLELFPEAKDRLAAHTRRVGITQVAALARLVEWFSAQDPSIQAAVLGLYPDEIAPEVAAILLKRMGKK